MNVKKTALIAALAVWLPGHARADAEVDERLAAFDCVATDTVSAGLDIEGALNPGAIRIASISGEVSLGTR